MIPYNFAYRGAFEYDKFILNIFQMHNRAVHLAQQVEDTSGSDIAKVKEQMNNIYESQLNDDVTSSVQKLKLLIK